ncbi:MAG: MATE family efflux transporter [Lachnospiraceae bacterium]|nr:MATE family efflux transporter [Lachnospiraceae bacterium]
MNEGKSRFSWTKIFKSLNGTKDMTDGKPMKLILEFGLPLLFGLIFQQMYNMVDSIIVGKKLGVDALAAVGSTGSINFMILGFCIGVCNGFAIPVAQTFGAKDFSNLKKYITNGAIVAVVFAMIMTAVVGIFTRQILAVMKTPNDIFEQAYAYIFIIFMGIPAAFLYNMVSGILRSLGDSVTPVIFLVFSSVLNVILDLLLVSPLGVSGAGYATVIAQAISGVISLLYMIKKYQSLNFRKHDWKFSGYHAVKLCGMGIPMGLQYSITAIGSVILQTAVNAMGEVTVAAVTAGSRISMLVCCPFDAMGSTMATFGGQNVGAGKLDRVDKGLKDCIKLGIIYAIAAFLFMLIFGRKLALLFLDNPTNEIITYIYYFVIANSAAYILLALVNIVRFMIQGLGFSTFAILAGVAEMFARAIAGFVLVPHFGYLFVILASPLAWVFADAFLIPAYLHVMKKLRQQIKG